MTLEHFLILCCFAVVMTGLVAGVFLTFSDFVMKSLSSAGPKVGIEAMQSINRKVYGSVFLWLLLGLTPLSIIIGVYAFEYVSGPARVWLYSGAIIYVMGVFAVTMICNVPMNKRLDAMNLETSPEHSEVIQY